MLDSTKLPALAESYIEEVLTNLAFQFTEHSFLESSSATPVDVAYCSWCDSPQQPRKIYLEGMLTARLAKSLDGNDHALT